MGMQVDKNVATSGQGACKLISETMPFAGSGDPANGDYCYVKKQPMYIGCWKSKKKGKLGFNPEPTEDTWAKCQTFAKKNNYKYWAIQN